MKILSAIFNKNRWVFIVLTVFVILIVFQRCKNKTETYTPIRKNIVDVVFAHGHTINSDAYMVATKTEGFIEKCFVQEGDEVQVGDLLFQLSGDVQSSQLENALAQYNEAVFQASPESPQINSLHTQINQAKSQVELDKRNYDRYTTLIKTNAVSKLEFEKSKLQYEASVSELNVLEKSLEDLENSLQLNLENAESQLKIQKDYYNDYFIKSKKNGLVLNIYKEQGELAKRGESLAKIGSGKIIAKLFIAEEDINHVKVGLKAKIALNTDKNNPVDAVITKIYPSFDVVEQSFILEAEFQKEDTHLLSNTQLQANIIIAEKENALVIPAYLLEENDQVRLRDNTLLTVETGIKSGQWVEIIGGLDENHSLKRKD